jgi:hypothetical protein
MTGYPIKVLLQTTIPTTADDWSIRRFSLIGQLLRDQIVAGGQSQFEVVMRDREPFGAPDSVLSTLDQSNFDELWLFAVDVGNGLTEEDCNAISRFRRSGRGLMVTRDHMDLGSSVCTLCGVGEAHHFHTRNPDPDASRRQRDDPYSTNISWPNYHSGANGDYQELKIVAPIHPVLADARAPTGAIRFLPSHPHEGAVSAPANSMARVIATGTSKVTGNQFNIAVAFEAGAAGGPAIAQSTFHHFADYNWDPRLGCPTFVEELPGDAIIQDPRAIADTHLYVINAALWLASASPLRSGHA